ncbi:hypothetical protein F0P96_17260 [Hymenobacter busanensis]|uniref:Uncharacterized protein n=2 Tax=Hymenobacter busanensis TaxID=2607656 RepID=A0A7L4ZT31_9BACT|nr:hypothetical protein [Hymenobacter busanensis]KAA9327724.1 hypothetical protein F0P96_17260 [Hymenobacter busanensis]QHJ05936.1 hypothetical protein GUY19_00965 [Hymenobacter busanensis]
MAKVSGNSDDVKALNGRLQSFLATLNQIIAEANQQREEPTPAYIRERLGMTAKPKSKAPRHSL